MILTRAAMRRVTPFTVFSLLATLCPVSAWGQNALIAAVAREDSPASVQVGSEHSDWHHVRRLRSGTQIIVTVVTSPAAPYEVIAADDESLTVLDTEALESSRHKSKLRRIDAAS